MSEYVDRLKNKIKQLKFEITQQQDRHQIVLKLMGVTDHGIKLMEGYSTEFLKYKLRKVEKDKEYLQHASMFHLLSIEYNSIEFQIESDIGTLDSYKLFLIFKHDPFYYNKKTEAGNVSVLKKLREDNQHLERFFDSLDDVKPNELESVNVDDCKDEIREMYYGKVD
jgi:hypothetical protein